MKTETKSTVTPKAAQLRSKITALKREATPIGGVNKSFLISGSGVRPKHTTSSANFAQNRTPFVPPSFLKGKGGQHTRITSKSMYTVEWHGCACGALDPH